MKNDKDTIKEKLTEEIILPESLSEENIIKLLEKENVRRSKKGNVRRFTSLAVAASIMIISVFGVLNRDRLFPDEIKVGEESTTADIEEVKASDHSELISFIKKYAEENKESYRGYSDIYYTADDEAVAEEALKAPVMNSAVESYSSHGITNIRTANVAESDIFITDGEYFYFINNSQRSLDMVKAEPDGSFTPKKTFTEENSDSEDLWYSGVYKYKNYLIAEYTRYKYDKISDDEVKSYNSVYYDSLMRGKTDSGVRIYDISDPVNAYLKKDISFDGELISTRIHEGRLILINQYTVTSYYYQDDESFLVPGVYFDSNRSLVSADSVYYSENDAPESYVTTAFIDLEGGEFSTQTLSVLGIAGETYCTQNNLYIMAGDYSSYKTSVSSFGRAIMIDPASLKTKITKIDIRGEKPEILCKGEFEGSILNSYSVDEYEGMLRVAATAGDENRVYVFDEQLKEMGRLGKIAEGERIKSVRFSGETAYVVTFLQTDPLFVIDLKNPQAPEIRGELKIPGFSSYLHPVGEKLLVGIGQGGTENGLDGSAKISLFDVSDPFNPKETDTLIVENANFMYGSKAYTAVSGNSFLIPVTIWNAESIITDTYTKFRSVTGCLYVSAENGELVLKNAYASLSDSDAERATFINDRIYLFSSFSGLCSFSMENGEFLHSLNINEHSDGFSALEENAEDILF